MFLLLLVAIGSAMVVVWMLNGDTANIGYSARPVVGSNPPKKRAPSICAVVFVVLPTASVGCATLSSRRHESRR